MDGIGTTIPITLVAAVILFYLVIVKVASLTSGWHRLKKLYKTQETFTGKMWYFESIGFRNTSYGGAVKIGVDNENIFLGVIPIFKFGHPDLVIPLKEITAEQPKEINIYKIKIYRNIVITFKEEPGIYFTITKKLAAKLEEESNGNFKYKRA